MSIINNGLLLAAEAAAAPVTGISRSLRFNSADSAYLSRTPGTAGNRDLWTLSLWVQRSKLGTTQDVFSAGTAGTDILYFNGSDQLCLDRPGATVLVTTQVFRDASAWYHMLLRIDSTNGTTSNKAKLYVNGSEVSAFSTDNRSALGASSFLTNTAILHRIGIRSSSLVNACDLYLADVFLIDGQALDPSSFGEFDTNGVWQPIAYAGSYGTNGFRLPFSDNSGTSSTTLGKDAAGSNNWTPNNFSVAAGAGNDSLVDVPLNGDQTDTGIGGEVRGNYATLNPVDGATLTLSNGNLQSDQATGTYGSARGTIGVSSGKWYWEVTSGGGTQQIGIFRTTASLIADLASSASGYVYIENGQKYNNGTGASYGASYTTNDVIGVALDLDAGTLVFYKNGATQGTAYSSLTGSFAPAVAQAGTNTNQSNFGQRPFAYTAPSGFKALCTTNLPEPTIADGSTVMDAVLYTGNGSTQTISGLGFSPDLVWCKNRTVGRDHRLFDTVRGIEKELRSSATDAEATDANSVTAFTSDGFTVGSNTGINESSSAIVAWTWDAGSSTVTNTEGSITSQVRANASAGFSVVTYTGNGTYPSTVGHGLGVAPHMIILKIRNQVRNWFVYHKAAGTGAFEGLNTTAAYSSYSPIDGSDITSTTFKVVDGNSNASSDTLVAYCFAPVAGYSSFGSYTGNGSADGPFVYTGFRPKWILVKSTSIVGQWGLWDATRNTFNVTDTRIVANLSNAELTNPAVAIDLLSNGFKLRNSDSDSNQSSATYIYAAFAESPFQYARAR
jgi:hypothetical protein